MKKQTRAVSAEQKQIRRDHIINTARSLLLTYSYDQIQMIEIAKAAGLAKGTLYLYFKTKEEVFLVILQEAYQAWFADLDQRLSTSGTALNIPQLTDLLVDLLDQHPLWLKLVPISHTILEFNIIYTAALEFKQQLAHGLMRSGTYLEKACAFIPQGQGAQLLLEIYAILLGVLNLAEPAPVVQKLIRTEPSLAAFQVDQKQMFKNMLMKLLTGTEISAKGGL